MAKIFLGPPFAEESGELDKENSILYVAHPLDVRLGSLSILCYKFLEPKDPLLEHTLLVGTASVELLVMAGVRPIPLPFYGHSPMVQK